MKLLIRRDPHNLEAHDSVISFVIAVGILALLFVVGVLISVVLGKQ